MVWLVTRDLASWKDVAGKHRAAIPDLTVRIAMQIVEGDRVGLRKGANTARTV